MLKKYLINTKVVILFLIFLLSVIVRIPMLTRPLGIHNENATAHTLVTLRSLTEQSINSSYLLPIYNYSGDENKNINNMPPSSIQGDKTKLYTYASFPVLGFLLPYIPLKFFKTTPSVTYLRTFSLTLNFISFFFIFIILLNTAQ